MGGITVNRTSIDEFLKNEGVAVIGIADALAYKMYPEIQKPTILLENAKSIVVFGLQFLTGSVIPYDTRAYTMVRNYLSRKIDDISIRLSYYLEAHGYTSIPTGAVGPSKYDKNTQKSLGMVSLKYSAYLAGLGSIGKNSLLINEKYGNMLWLGAVITEAPFEYDTPINESYCIEGCTLCVEHCPVSAIDSVTNDVNQMKCWEHAFHHYGSEEFNISCHTCRSICPMANGTK